MTLEVILIIILSGFICFMLGLFIAGRRKTEEELLYSKHLYEVKVRFLSKTGFIKTLTVLADNEHDATSKVLKKQFIYDGVYYPVYSIVSVSQLDKLEDIYCARESGIYKL